MIIATYEIDRAIYDSPNSRHNIMLVTTEYSYKSKKLVHLQIGKNFGVQLNNMLTNKFARNTTLKSEQFLYKNRGKVKALTYSAFAERLKQFDMSQTKKVQEVLVEYHYIGKGNQRDIVQIAITTKGSEILATIGFRDVSQHENFVAPAWLIEDWENK